MEPTRENETKRFEKVGKTSKNTVRRYKDKLVRLRILKEKQKKTFYVSIPVILFWDGGKWATQKNTQYNGNGMLNVNMHLRP